MWFVIKIIILSGSFLCRFFAKKIFKNSNAKTKIEVDNQILFISKDVKKDGKVISTTINMDFECNAIFKLSPEKWYDRFFKFLGLTIEIQTGEKQFDEAIYIASDNIHFKDEIRKDIQSRVLILELLAQGAQFVECNGSTLKMRFSGDKSGHADLMQLCVNLKKQLIDMRVSPHQFFSDPFATKVLFVEALIWSLGGYALAGFLEWNLQKQDRYLEIFPVVKMGLLCGLAIAGVILFLIFLLLRDSSRGHRIIVECFFVLLLSLPVGGVSAISDYNIQMDQSVPTTVKAKVTNLNKIRHRSSKGRVSYSYHLSVSSESSPILIPPQIEISASLFASLVVGGEVKIVVSKGKLNFAWYKSIEPIY